MATFNKYDSDITINMCDLLEHHKYIKNCVYLACLIFISSCCGLCLLSKILKVSHVYSSLKHVISMFIVQDIERFSMFTRHYHMFSHVLHNSLYFPCICLLPSLSPIITLYSDQKDEWYS